jgi:hypothetical protein
MNPSPSTSKPQAAMTAPRLREWRKMRFHHRLHADAGERSFELFSVTLRFFTRPLRSITNPSRSVPMLIKSRF